MSEDSVANPATTPAPDAEAPRVPVALRRNRLWVGIAFGLQGLLGAVVLTNLPGLEKRTGIGEAEAALVILMVLVFAAVGSLLGGRIAPRRGSAVLLAPAYLLQAVAVLIACIALPYWALFPVYALFGLGVGLADAGNSMQALVVQRAYGKPIMNRFFAGTTLAAIAGAGLVSLVNYLELPFEVSFAVAAVVALALVWPLGRGLAADPEVALDHSAKARLPWRGIVVLGLVVAAVYVGDGVASTWSTVHLEKTLEAAAWLAPLGYIAYQASVLIARLLGDAVNTAGRARLVAVAIIVAGAGLLLAAFAPNAALAVVGFALTGLGLGVLVPLSYSAAGDLAPEQTDEIVARLNLFNYGGVLIGSVATGIIADAAGLPVAIAIPAVLVLAALFAVPAYRARPAAVPVA